MAINFLNNQFLAKLREIVRWWDANVGQSPPRRAPDQLANRLVPFELTEAPHQNGECWIAKGMQLYYEDYSGYNQNGSLSGPESEIYFPLLKKAPPFEKDDRLFCIHRGRWEAIDSGLRLCHGKLDSALGENAATVNVKPDDDGEVITVKLPSYRIQQQSAGTKCRYFKTAGGFEMLDTDCGD